jgi:hypothetical protein
MSPRSNPVILFRIILVSMILMAGITHAQVLVKGPYLLYDNDNTRMEILWQNNTASTDIIRWGTDPSCAQGSGYSSEYSQYHQHKFTVSSLVPGGKYYYQVTVGTNTFSGSFHTAPPAGQQSLKFMAYGDSRTYPLMHNMVAGLINSGWKADEDYQTFIMSMGDLVTDGNYESNWTSELFNLGMPDIREMMANLPFLACRGNHEGEAKLFAKYFPYPYAANYYWSFDYGPAHFAAVDVYVDFFPGSAQYEWLVNDLASSDKPWKFIFLHEPAWSAYGGHPNNTKVQEYIEPLCEQYDIPIIFAGHNHYYARATIHGSNGTTIQHVTTGGGSGPLHSPDPSQPFVVVASKSYHCCKISIVDEDVLEFQAVSTKGDILDQFTINRPPVSISGVHAGFISADSAVITWITNRASSSEVAFGTTTAYGSSSTGPGGVITHSVSLSGLIADTVYHYQVISSGMASEDFTFHTGRKIIFTPYALGLMKGSLASGSSSDLETDNEVYMVVNSTKSGSNRKCDWFGIGNTSIPSASAVNLSITYNGRVSEEKSQDLFLYNWGTQKWNLFDTRNVGDSDVTVKFSTPSPADFISSTGDIRLRIYSGGGARSYSCSGDMIRFTVESAGYGPGGSFHQRSEAPKKQEGFSLSVSPNPFYNSAKVSYELSAVSEVSVTLYNLNGVEVEKVVTNTIQEPGKQEAMIDGSRLSGGIYICRLLVRSANGEVGSEIKKILVVK